MPIEGYALLLSFLTVLANAVGGSIVTFRRHLPPATIGNYLALGGGFLLAAVFLDVIPEALAEGSDAAPYIMLGFLLIYVSEHLLEGFFAKRQRNTTRTTETAISPAVGLASIVGWAAHDFFDGVAIGAGFLTSTSLGVIMFLAVMAHDVGSGFSVAATIRAGGWGRKRALIAAVAVGLTTVLGTAVTLVIGNIDPFLVQVFLALAAGTFIHIGASDLLPAAARMPSRLVFLWVLVGFALFYASEQLLKQLLP
ncbi:MAG: ZIP family metal transporter [Chloroflexi bacterium]|nr:ZIP family metal transporter [Chloroflexota bacterium]